MENVKVFQVQLGVINERPKNLRHYFVVKNSILKRTNTEISFQTLLVQRKRHKPGRLGDTRYDQGKCHIKYYR